MRLRHLWSGYTSCWEKIKLPWFRIGALRDLWVAPYIRVCPIPLKNLHLRPSCLVAFLLVSHLFVVNSYAKRYHLYLLVWSTADTACLHFCDAVHLLCLIVSFRFEGKNYADYYPVCTWLSPALFTGLPRLHCDKSEGGRIRWGQLWCVS